jgi:glucose/arabinose dehydrogenase
MDNGQIVKKRQLLRWLIVVIVVLAIVLAALIAWALLRDQSGDQPAREPGTEMPDNTPPATPHLTVETVVDGREHIWEVAFLPTGTMLFTERRGVLSALVDGEVRQIAAIEDVRAQGEGGLMGVAVDPAFEQNRYVFACFNSTQGDVRVARWRLSDDLSSLEDRQDIITGMPANTSGRHSGCRIKFGPDDMLWVTAGDAAMGTTPQDPASLGGKILRVTRDGDPAPEGNLGGDFDPRIFSYGHRNMQGLAFLDEPRDGVPGVSVEHGPGLNDEVNLLEPGNFGWDPVPGYNESVPMTDKQKFPDAIDAVWDSGEPTTAPSGAAFVYGEKWGAWQGALAISILKDQRVKFLLFDDNWELTGEQDRFVEEYGRLRAATLGPDQNLYVSTTNGQNDKILRITPQ